MYAVLAYDVANKMLCQFKMMERYYFIKCEKNVWSYVLSVFPLFCYLLLSV